MIDLMWLHCMGYFNKDSDLIHGGNNNKQNQI